MIIRPEGLAVGVPGVDFPEQRDVVDVIATGRGEVLVSWVEAAGASEIVVTVGEGRQQRRVSLPVGERLELVWRGPEELRALPVEIVGLLHGETPSWRLRPVGPATRGQRRSAVRAPLSIGLFMSVRGKETPGTTVDVSEAGARAVFEHSAPAVVDAAVPAPAPVAQPPLPSAWQNVFQPTIDPVQAVPAPAVVEAAVETAEVSDEAAEEAATFAGIPDAGDLVTLRLKFDADEVTCEAEVVRRIRREDRRPELTFRFIGMPEKTADRIRAQVFAQLRTLRARGLD